MKQYINREEAMEDLGVSKRSMDYIVSGIRDHMGPGKRYGQYSFRGSGKILQLRYAVLTDYMRYRDYLDDKAAAAVIPPFDVRAAERDLGVTSADFQPTVEIDVEAIAAAVVRNLAMKMAQ